MEDTEDTNTITSVVDGQRVLRIAPPLVGRVAAPTPQLPHWRAWVDLLDTTITAPSRAALPAAIEGAVAEAWQRHVARGERVTSADRQLSDRLRARICVTSRRDES